MSITGRAAVALNGQGSDPDGDPVTLTWTGPFGTASGASAVVSLPAGTHVITGNLTLQLRAERSSKGTGRVYVITIACTDAAGNSSSRTVTVTVPR